MVNPMVLVYERYITSCDLDFHSLQGKGNILSIKINQGLSSGAIRHTDANTHPIQGITSGISAKRFAGRAVLIFDTEPRPAVTLICHASNSS